MTNSFVASQNTELPIDDQAFIDSCWQQFNSQFPTEQACMEELTRRINEGEAQCRDCGSTKIEKIHGGRIIRCKRCYRKTWLTAQTFFHHVRLARPWLAAIFLMEHGVIISASRFQKLAGVAYSTAWLIFKKLTTVIHSQMEAEGHYGPSSLFGILFCKRSRETSARKAAFSEQEEIELANSQINTEATSQKNWREVDPGINLGQAEKEVYDILGNKPVHFDVLCQLTGKQAGIMSSVLIMLELANLIECMPGDKYARSLPGKLGKSIMGNADSLSESTRIAIDRITDFIGAKFQGISRKYLQNYLAAYWCYVDRRRWSCGALSKLCLQFRHIAYKEILQYVSPPLVVIGSAKSVF